MKIQKAVFVLAVEVVIVVTVGFAFASKKNVILSSGSKWLIILFITVTAVTFVKKACGWVKEAKSVDNKALVISVIGLASIGLLYIGINNALIAVCDRFAINKTIVDINISHVFASKKVSDCEIRIQLNMPIQGHQAVCADHLRGAPFKEGAATLIGRKSWLGIAIDEIKPV